MEDQENYDYTADYDPSNSSCSGSMLPDDHSANCTMSTIDINAVVLTPKKVRARSSSFTTASTSNGIQKKTPQRSTLPRSVLTSPRSSTKKTGGRSRQTPSRIMNQVADQVCKKIVRRKLELDDEDFLCKETDGPVKLLTGESVLDRNGCELKMDMDMTDLQKRYIMHVKGSVVAGEGLMNQLSTFSLN